MKKPIEKIKIRKSQLFDLPRELPKFLVHHGDMILEQEEKINELIERVNELNSARDKEGVASPKKCCPCEKLDGCVCKCHSKERRMIGKDLWAWFYEYANDGECCEEAIERITGVKDPKRRRK